MSVFVNTSAWYAAADRADRNNSRAKELLRSSKRLVTTDHVLLETWTLLRHRIHRTAAESFWEGLRAGVAHVEAVTAADLEAAWVIGRAFADQDFSLADRTSFAVMQRLGVSRVISFDNDFAVFRYGPARRRSFEVLH
jgi:predicted nucleic acid-binding protein